MPRKKKYNPGDKIRSRCFGLLLYHETEDYVYEDVLQKLIRLCDPTMKDYYAYNVHDKDELEDGTPAKVHTHFYIKFENARWNSAIADTVGVPIKFVEPVDKWPKAIQYLIHQNHPEKYQYDKEQIRSNYDVEPDLNSSLAERQKIAKILQFVEDNQIVRTSDVLHFALENDCYDALRRGGSLIGNVIKENRTYLEKMMVEYKNLKRNAMDEVIRLNLASFDQLSIEDKEELKKDAKIRFTQARKQQLMLEKAERDYKLHDGVMFVDVPDGFSRIYE